MVLVYQAYGREDVIRQTLFSVTSLLSVIDKSSPLQVWIYTDQQGRLHDFFRTSTEALSRIRLFPVSQELIRKWRGTIDFVHRVKVEVLMDAAKQFVGPLFYVDGDTYFRVDPTPLFLQVNDDTSLLHVAENVISQGRDPLSKKITKFLKKNKFQVAGREVGVSPDLTMYNAGAIGISELNKKWLSHTLELTDKTYALYNKHIMEQMAFSYYLQTKSKVIVADKEIGHYWDQKPEYQEKIDAFLAQNPHVERALANYAQFAWPPPKAQALPKKKLSILARLSCLFCRRSST